MGTNPALVIAEDVTTRELKRLLAPLEGYNRKFRTAYTLLTEAEMAEEQAYYDDRNNWRRGRWDTDRPEKPESFEAYLRAQPDYAYKDGQFWRTENPNAKIGHRWFKDPNKELLFTKTGKYVGQARVGNVDWQKSFWLGYKPMQVVHQGQWHNFRDDDGYYDWWSNVDRTLRDCREKGLRPDPKLLDGMPVSAAQKFLDTIAKDLAPELWCVVIQAE